MSVPKCSGHLIRSLLLLSSSPHPHQALYRIGFDGASKGNLVPRLSSSTSPPLPPPPPTPGALPHGALYRMGFDGASKGNPGRAGAGSVLWDEQGNEQRQPGAGRGGLCAVGRPWQRGVLLCGKGNLGRTGAGSVLWDDHGNEGLPGAGGQGRALYLGTSMATRATWGGWAGAIWGGRAGALSVLWDERGNEKRAESNFRVWDLPSHIPFGDSHPSFPPSRPSCPLPTPHYLPVGVHEGGRGAQDKSIRNSQLFSSPYPPPFLHPPPSIHHITCQLVCMREGVGHGTCNMAEYRAFIGGLELALALGIERIHVQGDSMLVVMQVGWVGGEERVFGVRQSTSHPVSSHGRVSRAHRGVGAGAGSWHFSVQNKWKVNAEMLREPCMQAQQLVCRFREIAIRHVPREWNQLADRLSNEAVPLEEDERVIVPSVEAVPLPTPTMPSGLMLRLDAEGRAIDFDAWLLNATLHLRSQLQGNVTLYAHASDLHVTTTFPAYVDYAICTDRTTRAHLATFFWDPVSGLYTLRTAVSSNGYSVAA
ncbi:unnamed protein product [Closterium sp. Yama58-4]|nr:unnamed protein product [Closterium sp. Yama58-4]